MTRTCEDLHASPPGVAGRPLRLIAAEILGDPGYTASVARYADVYVQAMADLTSLTDRLGVEDVSVIVAYAIVTLASWRGPTARRVKRELRALVALHDALPVRRRAY